MRRGGRGSSGSREVSAKLNELRLDALHFEGPGTDLTIGLASRLALDQRPDDEHRRHRPHGEHPDRGGVHGARPDPGRRDGHVHQAAVQLGARSIDRAARRFEGGRAVEIEAEHGADTLRTLTSRDEGAARLGEVALVDRESRVGKLGTVFYTTLLDENAASHLAFGRGYADSVEGDDNLARLNLSEIHIDFMVGADDVAVTGRRAGGEQVPLLRGGAWQI